MQTKSILKIWLLAINFEKFTSINLWGGPITTHQMLECDWSPHKFIEVNFPKLIIIIIIIKRGWQCRAGRERLTPYQSEDPKPTE